MRTITITPELAHVPNALPTFLLKADRPLPYRWWTRLSDHFAGRRDRTFTEEIANSDAPVVESPWLQRQLAECANAIARGRTRTEALVAVLDRELAALSSNVEQQEGVIASLTSQIATLQDAPVTDEVVGAGERYSDPSERLQRRHRERSIVLGQLRQSLTVAQDARRDLGRQIGTINQERRSHWVVLQERSRQLTELYQRRVCTYTRGMEQRRKGVLLTAPTVTMPSWASAALGTGGLDDSPAAPIFRLTSV